MTIDLPRVCIYCDKPADSVEHIFATWIIHELSRYTGRTFWQGTFTQGHETTTFLRRRDKKGNPTFEFTTDRVCRKCNNEWMNRLDDRVHRYLPNLIRGRPYVTNNKMCKAIAAWAVKTAITTRFAHINPNSVEGEWAAQLRKDEVPSREWTVWIAHYTGDRGLWYQQRELKVEGVVRIHPAPQEIEGDRPVYEDGVLMTLVVGQFCVQVLRINGPAFAATGPTDETIQIWPARKDLDWPPAKSLDDESLEAFASRFVDGGMVFAVHKETDGLPEGESPQPARVFASSPVTPEELATEENYVIDFNVNCGECNTDFAVSHNTGTPLSRLTMPYSASVPSTCPDCGESGTANFTLHTIPGSQGGT